MTDADLQPQADISAGAASLPAVPLAATFTTSANDFVHGELKQESLEAVSRLHQRFSQRIQATVDAALPGCQDQELKDAAVAYCVALSRTRKEVAPKQLAEKLAQGAEPVKAETKTMLKELSELEDSLKLRLSDKDDTPRYSVASKPIPGEFHPFRAMLRGLAWLFGAAPEAPSETSTQTPPQATPETSPAAARNDNVPAISAPGAVPAEKPADPPDRIYFRLNDYSRSPVLPFIQTFLEAKGYTITDYENGYAKDQRKNTLKIGKLLKDAPGLYEAYKEDPFRMSKNLVVVVTRSYEDLARASFGRGWQSCRSNAYSAVENAISEINTGVMAAYLISEDDPDIHNPLGRVNLKPYDTCGKTDEWGSEIEPVKGKKGTIYQGFNPIGLHHPGFVDAVNRYAEEQLNGNRYGKFKLRKGCESYREFQVRTRLPADAEAALKIVGAKFTKDGEGKITVKGDLNLSNLGLSHLPDLRGVVVEGGIDVSKNKLLTLEGLPTAPVKFLDASNNLLFCFAGCTPDVGRKFNYKDCCYLMTTYGAPKAESYEYGNGLRDSKRYAAGAACIGPVEEPERFPGFKRDK